MLGKICPEISRMGSCSVPAGISVRQRLGNLSPRHWGWLVLGVACPSSLLSFQPSPGSSNGMRKVRGVQVWQVTFSTGKISSPFTCTRIAFALKESHHGVCAYLCVQEQSVLMFLSPQRCLLHKWGCGEGLTNRPGSLCTGT